LARRFARVEGMQLIDRMVLFLAGLGSVGTLGAGRGRNCGVGSWLPLMPM